MKMEKYKVVLYKEGGLGTIVGGILGSGAKVDPRKFSDFLNQNASQGWQVVTMEKNVSRMLLLFKREEYLVIMKRPMQKKKVDPSKAL